MIVILYGVGKDIVHSYYQLHILFALSCMSLTNNIDNKGRLTNPMDTDSLKNPGEMTIKQ